MNCSITDSIDNSYFCTQIDKQEMTEQHLGRKMVHMKNSSMKNTSKTSHQGKINGCTTFRLNPFRRMDNSSNTTIGLKKGFGTTLRLKKIKDFRRIVAPVIFFVISGFFFIKPVLLQKCSTVLSD